MIFGSAFLLGLSKTGITGLSVLAVAISTSVLPAREAVGATLLTLLGGDIFAVLFYRRSADWSQLVRLFPWAAAGVISGALTLWLGKIDNNGARRMIGVILLILILWDFARRWMQKGRRTPTRPAEEEMGRRAGRGGGRVHHDGGKRGRDRDDALPAGGRSAQADIPGDHRLVFSHLEPV